jgi:hypothetical protein
VSHVGTVYIAVVMMSNTRVGRDVPGSPGGAAACGYGRWVNAVAASRPVSAALQVGATATAS